MKHYMLFILLGLWAGIAAAQDLSGAKICINPGHGGHDSDDRYISETGFWESEGNLTKGLHLRDLLERLGAEVVMTRTTNTTEDDLPLSQISEMANAHNVDYFHSIHSNAFDGATNYPLVLFRGYDDDPVFPTAKAMGDTMWHEMNDHGYGYWKYSWVNNRGDWSFYSSWGTQGLGVLRSLEMPGTLSEGSFHDYIPESWRLMNLEYREFESWLMLRSFLKMNEAKNVDFGLVNGVVRDNNVEVQEYSYIEGSDDDMKPVNEVSVSLKGTDHHYTGDTLNNGYFLMDSVEAGTYTIVYNADGYLKDSAEIEVTKGGITRAGFYLQRDTTIAPEVIAYAPNTEDSVMANSPIEITFGFPMDTASFKNAFQCDPQTDFRFEWDENMREVVGYPQLPYQKATNYTITVDSVAKSKYGFGMENDFSFSFLTKNRNRLVFKGSYPEDGERQVPPYPEFHLYFDAPLNQGSLVGNILLKDSEGEEVPYYRAKVLEENGNGEMLFSPREALEVGGTYRVYISGEVEDKEGIPVVEPQEVEFSVRPDVRVIGNILEPFEDHEAWLSLAEAPNTSGINPAASEFVNWPYFKLYGDASAKLSYSFDEAGGTADMARTEGLDFTLENPYTFGIWVYGDLSGNILKVAFEDPDGLPRVLRADTIDWAGWELVPVDLNDFGESGSATFTGIRLQNAENGAMQGKIYFDNAGSPVDVATKISQQYTMEKLSVYPNPASERIVFPLPEAQEKPLRISIYNASGKMVMRKTVGSGSFEWNIPENMQEGIYMYRITEDGKPHSSYAGKFMIK